MKKIVLYKKKAFYIDIGYFQNFPDPPVEEYGTSRGVLKMKIWKIPGGYV